MTNVKSTKKALIASILSLCMCFSMLLGTTFAWFTDSVTSANNVITAGNLDVELEYAKVKDGEIVKNGNEIKWTTVQDSSEVFDPNALWEPGRVEVVYLKVSNLGSLEFKYQLNINNVMEIPGVNVDDESFKLSEHLVFKVVELDNESDVGKYDTYAKAVEAAGTEKGLANYNDETTNLEVKGTDYVAVIVYMPETVGNEANYRGDAIPQIHLGINLFATQVTGEGDSFGPDYDANAPMYNVLVTNEAEFVAALANAKNGDVIGISGNVTWTTGAEIGSTPFATNTTTFSTEQKDALTYITLVGVGEDATFTATGKGVGAIGIDNGTVVFKNLKIVDESVSYVETAWEYGYLEFRGNTVFEDCEIVNAIMMEGDSATFKNCSFNSNKSSEYAVWVSDGVASFENCYFTGPRGIKVHEAYGSKVDTVVINNNRFIGLSEKPGLAIGTVDADTKISLTSNEFIGTQAGDQSLYSYETDTNVETFDFVYESNKVDGETKVASTVDELKSIAEDDAIGAKVLLTSGTYNMGGTFSLAEGVELIGDGDVTITGTLSGTLNNTTIKNVHIKSGNAQRWGYSEGNLVFENCTFEATSVYAIHYDGLNGANITYKDCTIIGWVAIGSGAEYVTFDGCKIYGNGTYGLIRLYSPGTIKNCTFDVDNVNTTDVFQDGIHAVDCTVDVIDCTNVNGHVTDLFNTSGTGVITVDGATSVRVSNTTELVDAINGANTATIIWLEDGKYEGNIDITLAAIGSQKGDLIFKAVGDNAVIAGTVTLGYRNQGVGATMWNANVTFDGITFDHANDATHSLDVQDVKSLTLKNCTIIGDGEYGIASARGNATGASRIVECTFENAGMQLLGNFATGLVIDSCTFNESCINVQAGNGVTVQNCEFNATLADENVGDSFYLVRSNSTPITVKNCEIKVDSTVTGVASAQAKWYLLANRGTTNWTVENVAVTLTDAALAQTELKVTACTSTGVINTTNLTVNGVAQ